MATIESEFTSETAETKRTAKKLALVATTVKAAVIKAASVTFSTTRLFVGVALVVITALQFVGGGVNNMTLFTGGMLLLISALLLIKR